MTFKCHIETMSRIEVFSNLSDFKGTNISSDKTLIHPPPSSLFMVRIFILDVQKDRLENINFFVCFLFVYKTANNSLTS